MLARDRLARMESDRLNTRNGGKLKQVPGCIEALGHAIFVVAVASSAGFCIHQR
jgi:hypothetical protein